MPCAAVAVAAAAAVAVVVAGGVAVAGGAGAGPRARGRASGAAIARLAAGAGAWAIALLAAPVAAQGTCGAAGGAPPGPSASVCDYAAEATGVRPPGPSRGAGNPVDLATGNKYRFERDLWLPGPLPLVFARHYNSRNRHAGALGPGWSHSLETRVAIVRGARGLGLQVIQGDGRRIVFEPDPGRRGRWRTPHVTDGVIERTADALPASAEAPPADRHGWAWRVPGGRTLRFDRHGRLRSVAQAGAVRLVVEPDAHGRTVAATGGHPARLELRWIETPHGPRLAALAVQGRERVRYAYDAAGQLASVSWPDGRERRFRYDDPVDPLLLTEVLELDAPGLAARSVARHRYDPQGRAVRVETADEAIDLAWTAPASRGGVASVLVADDSGRRAIYRFTYDARRHVVRWLSGDGEPCALCPPAPSRHRYDASGRLVRTDGPDGGLALEYDAIGRPRAAWRLDRPGGTPTRLWRVAYADDDPVATPSRIEQPSVAPGRMHTIVLESDARGRVARVVERGFEPRPAAGGGLAYSAMSRRFEFGHRDPTPADPATDAPSPALAALAWVDGPLPGPADRIVLRAQGTADDGRLQLLHPSGDEETLRFEHGVPVEHRAIGGARTPLGPQAAAPWAGGAPVPGAFVGSGRIEVLHDRTGQPRALRRTDWQRGRIDLVAADAPAAGPERPDAPRATHEWRGEPVRVVLADGSVWARGFDDFGRVAWIDAPGRPRAWARWDAADRLIEHRPGDGHVLRHDRDAAGRPVHTRRIAPDGTQTTLGRYRWDGTRLVEASNDTVTLRYGRDALGRVDRIEHTFARAPDAPLVYRWHRDLAGRVVAETLPDGVRVRYAFRGREVVGLEVDGVRDRVRIDAYALREPRILSTDPPPAAPASTRPPTFGAGRLLSVAGFVYPEDPHGRRAAKHRPHDARTTEFVHHDWRLRTERDASGRLRHWLWVGAQPVARIEDGRLLRLVTDARRAPVRALGADGRTAWSARYDRLGAATIAPGAKVDVPLRLPGQYHDDETGWHHNHWRTYDPRAGRYLEPDPLGLQPSYRDADGLYEYADGDPLRGADPWGLARITWFALTTGVDGRPLGRTQGFDRARWSFIIEDVQPVDLTGLGRSPPRPAGVDGLLFDPWGDFVRARPDLAAAGGNRLDAIAWRGATGRDVFAAFAAHYEPSLARIDRFVVDGFDDRRAGALALILAATPSERAQCVASVLGALPGIDLGPAQRRVPVAMPRPAGEPVAAFDPPRLLDCTPDTTLPVRYADDLERDRVERLQAAAELQESPTASIGAACDRDRGCRSRTRIEVHGRTYWASYGRTQFTVATFLAELARLAAANGGADADALRAAVGLARPILLGGRPATAADALTLARSRVEAAYRAFAGLRAEFGRGVPADRAEAAWDALPAARRDAFTAQTGLGRTGFVDMLGYAATGLGGRTEEEGRHALAASAAATVRFVPDGAGEPIGFDTWLEDLFASRDPYDHLSRAFLRDNLRRVLAAPALAGRFDNAEAPDSEAWRIRQMSIELDLARRVAVLHNAGRMDLAGRPDLETWLAANPAHWVVGYVEQFTRADERGNWEALRCAPGLHGPGGGLQLTALTAMPPAPARTGAR